MSPAPKEVPMQGKKFILVIASAAVFMADFAQQARAHDEPVVGSLVGAGIGPAIAGPPGAAVGAVIGAAIASHEAHKTDHNHARNHRHPVVHSHVRERTYASPAPYAQPAKVAYANGSGNGNGGSYVVERVVRCEPDPAYRPRIVHLDDRPRVLPIAPVQQPKMKKVCKFVPARQASARQ